MLLVVCAGGFGAAVVSGVVGFGGGLLFLPVLVWAVGLRAAVPLLTLCLLVSNSSRLALNWRATDWRGVAWFTAGAFPGSITGARLFAVTSAEWLTPTMGALLIAMVISRRMGRDFTRLPSHPWLVPVGLVTGGTSALVGGVGPFVSPFFLSLGLVKESFIATEAACALAMHGAKTAVYGDAGLIDGGALLIAAIASPLVVAGSFVAKRVVSRTPPAVFVRIVEVALLALGAWFVVKGALRAGESV